MNKIKILRNAKSKISDSDKWLKKVFGRNKKGMSTGSWNEGIFNEQSVAFCARGAIIASIMDEENTDFFEAEKIEKKYFTPYLAEAIKTIYSTAYASKKFGHYSGLPKNEPSVALFNNHKDTTHKDVMAVFEGALVLAKEEGN